MRPTTSELLTNIVTVLENQVAPHVQDKWAASSLRSAAQLLKHLVVRTEDEGRVLIEDNQDARAVLAAVAAQLKARPQLAALRAEVERAIEVPAPDPHDDAALDACNEIFQVAIERLLRQRDPVTEALGASIHDELRNYLRRRLEREFHLYFPVFTGPPF